MHEKSARRSCGFYAASTSGLSARLSPFFVAALKVILATGMRLARFVNLHANMCVGRACEMVLGLSHLYKKYIVFLRVSYVLQNFSIDYRDGKKKMELLL